MNIPTVSICLAQSPAWASPRKREREMGGGCWAPCVRRPLLRASTATCRGLNPSRPVPLWGRHSWLWPRQDVADVQCFRSLEPRSRVLWKGQILGSLRCWWWCNTLSCHRTELCSCGVGRLCIRPKAASSRFGRWLDWSRWERTQASSLPSPFARQEQPSALEPLQRC